MIERNIVVRAEGVGGESDLLTRGFVGESFEAADVVCWSRD